MWLKASSIWIRFLTLARLRFQCNPKVVCWARVQSGTVCLEELPLCCCPATKSKWRYASGSAAPWLWCSPPCSVWPQTEWEAGRAPPDLGEETADSGWLYSEAGGLNAAHFFHRSHKGTAKTGWLCKENVRDGSISAIRGGWHQKGST